MFAHVVSEGFAPAFFPSIVILISRSCSWAVNAKNSNDGMKGKDVVDICPENVSKTAITGTEDYFTVDVCSRSVRADGIVIKPALTMIPSE